jgi:hypothetical protein
MLNIRFTVNLAPAQSHASQLSSVGFTLGVFGKPSVKKMARGDQMYSLYSPGSPYIPILCTIENMFMYVCFKSEKRFWWPGKLE